MGPEFNAEMRCQSEWGWLLAFWLFLSGTAGALFLLYQVMGLPGSIGNLAIGLMLLGGGVLLLEQGSPSRFWRAVTGIRTSWLSRGTVFVVTFVLFGTLSLALKRVPAWPANDAFANALGWIASLSALMVVLYPGLFLSNHRSVPFWRTPMLPIVLAISGIAGASAVILVALPWLDRGLDSYRILAVGSNVAAVSAFCVYLVSMARRNGAASEAVRLLNRPPLAWFLWGGVFFIGSIVPVTLLLAKPEASSQFAGACMLVGCLLLRYCVLKAGVLVPAALAQKGFELLNLNRTNLDDLAREYGHATVGTPANER
ncbi:MAG: polysulfide reductase NrfD [Burkholderiaceae bacterium]|nr:polysulfide reductase NrfD [Burkholderiaceae bacterium]